MFLRREHLLGAAMRMTLLVFGAYLAFTLFSVLGIAPFFDYACKATTQVKSVMVVLPMCLLIIGFVFFLGRKDKAVDTVNGNAHLLRGVLFVSLLLAQLYLQWACGFTNGWDVEVLTARARGVVDLSTYAGYLSQYPNQLFLFGLFTKIAAFAKVISVDPYTLLSVVSLASVDVSILLVSEVCAKQFGELPAIKFQLISSLLVGLSPWVMVPYSDTFGLLFVSLILWCWVCIPKLIPSAFFISFFTLLGYRVKPTAIFVTLSISFFGCLSAIMRSRQDANSAFSSSFTKVSSLLCGIAVVCGLLLAGVTSHYVAGSYVDINPNASYGMTHFLAMGINPDARGVYSVEENVLSSGIADPRERKAAQIQLWREHLENLGPTGLAKLLFQKNLTTYADGTFAWKVEGTFFTSVTGKSTIVRSIYGITMDQEEQQSPEFVRGERGFRLIEQAIWLAVLVLACMNCFRAIKHNQSCEQSSMRFVAVMALSLLMLSAFLLIFECRARYLFLYSLFYVALAVAEPYRSWNKSCDTKI